MVFALFEVIIPFEVEKGGWKMEIQASRCPLPCTQFPAGNNGSTIIASSVAVSSSLLSDRIASCALKHYNTQLTKKKGKPKSNEEWTVFAAIVAFHRVDGHLWVVSSATGTKCTAKRHKGCILHDAHAEVLARRGLIRVILSEIAKKERRDINIETQSKFNEKQKKKKTDTVNCMANSPNLLIRSSQIMCTAGTNEVTLPTQKQQQQQKYQLDPNLEIHLYVSDSPCGDASIYPVDDVTTNSNKVLFTGAKVIVSEATRVDATDCGGNHQLLPVIKNNNACAVGNNNNNDNNNATGEENAAGASIAVVAREEIQVLGKLRTKSGRSNIPAHMRSHSHSCSDKIVSWSILGLQGALLTKFLNPPIIPLTSVIVSRDSRLEQHDNNGEQWQQQLAALKRAIPFRVQSLGEFMSANHQQEKLPSWVPSIPTVHIVSEIFVPGKAAMIASPKTKLSGEKRKHFGGINNDNKEIGDMEKKDTINNSKVSPCGMAINWNQNEDIEVLVGARGILHGKKPKTPEDNETLASRLCRAKIIHDFFLESSTRESKLDGGSEHSLITTDEREEKNPPVASSSKTEPLRKTYHQIKEENACREWIALKDRILTEDGSPLVGWLRNSSTGDDNFIIE
jgi:hypothetical protein